MATVNLEISRFTVTKIKGTDIEDKVIGTVNGAVHGAAIKRIRDNPSSGESVYEVIVVHDDGTPIAIEATIKTVTLTENETPVLNATLDTVAGAVQAVDISRRDTVGNKHSFDIGIVHLNA